MTVVGASLGVTETKGFTVAPVIDVTAEALVERRRVILDGLGMDLAEFAELSASRTLSGEEWEAKEELDGIAFLLGDE